MATNVTEKDKTLNDVIEWCGEQVSGIEKKDSHGVGRGFPQRRTMHTAGRRGVLRNRRLYGHAPGMRALHGPPVGAGAGRRPGDSRRLAERRIPSDARKGTAA